LDTPPQDIKYWLNYWVYFEFDFNEEAKDCGPKNKWLFHSLVSALSIKHRLCRNSIMFSAIVIGLGPCGADDPGNISVPWCCTDASTTPSISPTLGIADQRSLTLIIHREPVSTPPPIFSVVHTLCCDFIGDGRTAQKFLEDIPL
jgi:hypothetical protein